MAHYYCIASNSVGDTQKHFRVNVQGKLDHSCPSPVRLVHRYDVWPVSLCLSVRSFILIDLFMVCCHVTLMLGHVGYSEMPGQKCLSGVNFTSFFEENASPFNNAVRSRYRRVAMWYQRYFSGCGWFTLLSWRKRLMCTMCDLYISVCLSVRLFITNRSIHGFLPCSMDVGPRGDSEMRASNVLFGRQFTSFFEENTSPFYQCCA